MADPSFPPVFVINLKQSDDRRQVMAERLDPLKIPYSFFEAVNGHELDLAALPAYDSKRRRLFFGRDLTKGEVGCLLSHRAIYQHMVDKGIDKAVVLEDDTFISPEFPEVVRALQKLPFEWDMIRFLAQKKVQGTGRTVYSLPFKNYTLARLPSTPGGAYGYMLTKKAAEKLLHHMQRNVLPVDILHGYVWRTGLEVFALRPSPVSADMEGPSTIGYGQRFDKTLQLSKEERLVYPFTRAWLKISELTGKRMAYLMSWVRDQRLKKLS